MVIDAGGGTIDISTYGQPGGAEAGFFEEVSIPECGPSQRSEFPKIDVRF